MSASIPPVAHLRTTKQFQLLYRRGFSCRTAHLRVLWIPSGALEHRWGVVVSVKISKLATRRNRMRRILFADLAIWAIQHPKPALDAVVIVTRPGAEDAALRQELAQALRSLSRRIVPKPVHSSPAIV